MLSFVNDETSNSLTRKEMHCYESEKHSALEGRQAISRALDWGGRPFDPAATADEQSFDDFFSRSSRDLWGGNTGAFQPLTDVSETDKEVRITAELPGLHEKDVEVMVDNNRLIIKGEKKAEKEEQDGQYYHSERSYGYFDRTVELPQGIDADKGKAEFKKGVLKVTLPKKPEAQRYRRRIELTES